MALGWVIEEGRFGPRMVVLGPWSESMMDAARSAGIRGLELNSARGWAGGDLSFLIGLADLLEEFSIIDWTTKDVGHVHALIRLRMLNIDTYCNTELRFVCWPGLEECSLEWRPKAHSLFKHRGIKRLFINRWNQGQDLHDFADMTQLKSLRLYSPTRLQSLHGIEKLVMLVQLEVALATRLTSLAGVGALPRLELLSLHTCRKIGDIAPISSLLSLRELHLLNCGSIASIKPLRGLQELERFLFYESTNVVDGDLSPLKDLPKLREVAFMERSHYSLKRHELPSGELKGL